MGFGLRAMDSSWESRDQYSSGKLLPPNAHKIRLA